MEPWLGAPTLTKVTSEDIVSFTTTFVTVLPPGFVTRIVSSYTVVNPTTGGS